MCMTTFVCVSIFGFGFFLVFRLRKVLLGSDDLSWCLVVVVQ